MNNKSVNLPSIQVPQVFKAGSIQRTKETDNTNITAFLNHTVAYCTQTRPNFPL